MAKRGVLFLTIIALALTLFSFGLSRRDSRDWRANRSRRLFPFPWQDTLAFTITRPDGETLQFRRDTGDTWTILLPGGARDTASNFAVDELSALATLPWREPLADAPLPSPGTGIVLTAESVTGQTLNLLLGDPVRSIRPVIIDNDPAIVYGVNQEYLRFLDWPTARFRKYTLANAGTGQRPAEVILSPGGDQASWLVLGQSGDGWQLKKPMEWPADPAAIDALLLWIDRLRADRIEVEQTDDLERYGFGIDSVFVESFFPGRDGTPGIRRKVEFGAAAGDGAVYARETTRTPVFLVSDAVLAEVFPENAKTHPEQWKNSFRRRTLNALGKEPPAGVVLEQIRPVPASLTVTKNRNPGEPWTGILREGAEERTFAVDAPDSEHPSRPLSMLFAGLADVRIVDFYADLPPGPETSQWTAFPAFRLSVLGEDGRTRHSITLYNTGTDGFLSDGEGQPARDDMKSGPDGAGGAGTVPFSMDNRPAVLTMAKADAALFAKPLYQYQSLRLVDSDPALWTRVEIFADGDRTVYTRERTEINEQWWRGEVNPQPLMDDNNVFVNLLVALSQLRSEGYVQGANGLAEKFGLDQPAITAIVYISPEGVGEENAILFELAVGGESKSDPALRYARLNNSGPVFLLPERIAGALVRKYQ